MDLFSDRAENRDFENNAPRAMRTDELPTGFWENFGESLRMEFEEESSLSEAITGTEQRERRKKIFELYEGGVLPKEVVEQFKDTSRMPYANAYPVFDEEGLTQWINENTEYDLPTDAEIEDRLREELKMKRDYGQDVYTRSNWKGKVGDFLGGMSGDALDPMYLPSYFVGVGPLGNSLSLVPRVAVKGGVAAAVEAPLIAGEQAMVYDWKQKIMSPYSKEDAYTNVLVGTLGVGVLTGTVGGVVDGLKGARKRLKADPSPQARQAETIIDNEITENTRLDKNGDYREQKEMVESAVTEQNESRMKDYVPDEQVEEVVDAKFDDEVDVDDLYAQYQLVRKEMGGCLG